MKEIWGEGRNEECGPLGGEDETKNLDLLGDEASNRVMYTQKA